MTVRRFIEAYEARFGEGSAFEAAGVELTTFRVVLRAPTVRPELKKVAIDGGGRRTCRRAADLPRRRLGAGADLLERPLVPGAVVEGLAVIELPDTTIVVGPGETARVDEYGSVVIELSSHGGGHGE